MRVSWPVLDEESVVAPPAAAIWGDAEPAALRDAWRVAAGRLVEPVREDVVCEGVEAVGWEVATVRAVTRSVEETVEEAGFGTGDSRGTTIE